MELGKVTPHRIIIYPSDNHGFVVNIGCGQFVARSVTDLLADLEEYLSNPEEWEKEYNKSRKHPMEEVAREAESFIEDRLLGEGQTVPEPEQPEMPHPNRLRGPR